MRRGRKMTLFLMIMIISLSFCKTLTADAASVSFSLPVSIELDGDLPVQAEQFQIKLVPEEPDFPMPEDGKGTLSIYGEDTENYSDFIFEHPGVYRYIIYQIKGDSECTYDQREYQLIITVLNSSIEEKELELSVALYGEEGEGKIQAPVFFNEYPVEADTENTSQMESETESVKTGVEDYSFLYMVTMLSSLILACGIIQKLYWKWK